VKVFGLVDLVQRGLEENTEGGKEEALGVITRTNKGLTFPGLGADGGKDSTASPGILHNTVIRSCIYPVSYLTTTYCCRTARG